MTLSGKLDIDLSAISANYASIQAKAGKNCEVAAVVKANAYGLGMAAVAPALRGAGAKTFFVATLPEAIELRSVLGAEGMIAMLNGFIGSHASIYRSERITPILNSLEDAAAYRAASGLPPPIIHIDTGMNRLGIRPEDIEALSDINPSLVMSHFACSDEDSPMNEAQFEAFKKAAAKFSKAKKSLCNSSGIFRSDAYHFDLVRPGMALYGLNPTPDKINPMRPVVKISVPVLQIRKSQKGESAGYNATYRFEKETPLAIVSLGYADGFLRALSNKGTLYWNGIACPVRGRVSMDLTIVDLSNVPESHRPHQGDMMEVIGRHQSADDIAAACGTIGYEILTSLSRRYERNYKK